MNITRFWKWKYIIPAAIVGAPIALAVFVVVFGGVVMLLWNWLLPPLFGWPQITLLQGFGLLALCRILFGHMSGGGNGGPRSRRISDEDRARFRERMRGRFGCDAPPDIVEER